MTGENKRKKKKKLTLTSVGVILLVIIVAANIYLWKNQAGNRVQIDNFENQISLVQQKIGEMPEPADDLESRLEKVKAELAAAQEGFPGTVDRNEVLDYILNVAEECRVQIVPLVSDGWVIENIGQSYRVLKISGTISGSLENANSFITSLQNGKYPTLTISEFAVQRTDGSEVSVSESEMQVVVDLKIALYTFSPAAEEDAV